MEALGKVCIVIFVSLLFLVNYNTASLEIRGIGDACTENTTCSAAVKNAFCSSEGLCKCDFDIISEDKTRCLVRIGGPCQENEDCARGEGLSECSSGSNICACARTYTHSTDLTECLKIIDDLNDLCKEDAQCRFGKPGNLSSCRPLDDGTKKCRCNDNAVDGPSSDPTDPTSNKCYLVSEKVGDPCEIQTQCTVKLMHSQCKNAVCVCADDYVSSPDSSECLPKMFLGQSCRFSAQCDHIEDSTCSFINSNDPTGLCQCSAEYTTSPERNDLCLKKAIQIGDSCADPVQCVTVANSMCIEEKCDCTPDYVSDQAGKECLLKVPILNGTCSEDGQCQVKNSSCEIQAAGIRQCKCITNQFVESRDDENSCVEIVHERNKPCKEEVQCVGGLGPLSTCADGVCQCKLNYGYYNGECYSAAKLDEACQVVEECYLGVNNLTVCSGGPLNGRCRCLSGAITFQNKCFDPSKRVGSSCDSHDECTVSIIGNVYCDAFTKSCACQLGSTPTASDSMCTSGALNIHQYFSFLVTLLILIVLGTTF